MTRVGPSRWPAVRARLSRPWSTRAASRGLLLASAAATGSAPIRTGYGPLTRHGTRANTGRARLTRPSASSGIQTPASG